MTIQFNERRWKDIRDTYKRWWNRALERPVINLTFIDAPSSMKQPENYRPIAMWQYPEETPINQILRDDLYTLSTQRFAADAFPMTLPDYGAGVNAAFCGSKVERREETVWFLPPAPDIAMKNFHLKHDPGSTLYMKLREYYKQSYKFFEGNAIVGMTHLNNGIDIPARFFEGNEMCLALYDYPDEVKRLTDESHRLFLYYLEDLSTYMGDVPGYSCWGHLYGEKPWFGTQSDFCAMIGPDTFSEFILPELKMCWQAFPETNYYHLDGPGQLPHLDMILDSPSLRCVQWVPGDGAPLPAEWVEIYKRISNAGKNIWYMGKLEDIEGIADAIGTTRGLYWQGYMPWEYREHARTILKHLGVTEEF